MVLLQIAFGPAQGLHEPLPRLASLVVRGQHVSERLQVASDRLRAGAVPQHGIHSPLELLGPLRPCVLALGAHLQFHEAPLRAHAQVDGAIARPPRARGVVDDREDRVRRLLLDRGDDSPHVIRVVDDDAAAQHVDHLRQGQRPAEILHASELVQDRAALLDAPRDLVGGQRERLGGLAQLRLEGLQDRHPRHAVRLEQRLVSRPGGVR